jgi:hypothetical protein
MERETLNERETQKNVRFPLGDPSSSLSMGYLQYSEGIIFSNLGFLLWYKCRCRFTQGHQEDLMSLHVTYEVKKTIKYYIVFCGRAW